MTRTLLKRTDQFETEDQNGKIYKIIEYTTFLEPSPSKQPEEWIPGLKNYELEDGTVVNRLSDTEFEALSVWGNLKLTILT